MEFEGLVGIIVMSVFAVVIVSLGFNLFIISELSAQKSVTSSGVISHEDLGVYSDEACSQPMELLNWGNVTPASSTNKTLYLKNEGINSVTVTMHTQNYNPLNATLYFTCSWDKEGVMLAVNESVEATMTLDVAANVTGIDEFSFDIIFGIET